MFLIIWMITAVIVLLRFRFNYMSTTSPNGNYLLGITLPAAALNDPEMVNMAAEYRRKYNRYTLVFAALALLMPAMYEHEAFLLIYGIVWCIALIRYGDWLFVSGIRKAYACKQERGWFVGNTQSVRRIDTAVSAQSDTMPLSSLWFLPSCAAALYPVIRTVLAWLVERPGSEWLESERLAESSAVMPLLVVLPICGQILAYAFYRIYARGSNRVYTADSAQNLIYNRIRKRSASKATLAWAYCMAAGGIVWYHTFLGGKPDMRGLAAAIVCDMAGAAIFLSWVMRSARRRKEWAAGMQEEEYLEDEDRYWLTGTYCNPDDKRFCVEGRAAGQSMVFNMGNPVAKTLIYAMYAALIAIAVWLIPGLLAMEFVSFDLELRKDGRIVVDTPVYPYEFSREEIIRVELLDTMPENGTRTNGIGASEYLAGHFEYQGYGECMVYIFSENAPYLCIELKDGYVFFSTRDDDGAREWYEKLNGLTEPNS